MLIIRKGKRVSSQRKVEYWFQILEEWLVFVVFRGLGVYCLFVVVFSKNYLITFSSDGNENAKKIIIYIYIYISSSHADNANFPDSLSIHPYHPLPSTGFTSNILCLHRSNVNWFLLVGQH